MSEKRYHIEIAPGAVGTFNTPNPSPEVIDALKEVVRLAMLREDVRGRVSDQSGAEGSSSERSEESSKL